MDGKEIEKAIFDKNLSLPDPDVLLFFQNLERRVIWLNGDVSDDWTFVADYIMRWNVDDVGVDPSLRKPIKLFINTNGGDFSVCTCIMDAISASVTPVWGINLANAYSAGAFIFMCCHRRFAAPNCSFMIHRGSGMLAGNQADTRAYSQEWDRLVTCLHDMVIKKTKIGKQKLDINWDRDWYFGAGEAIDLGFADELLLDFSIMA